MSTTSLKDAAQFSRETGEHGEFKRQESRFRDWVRADGSTRFPAAAGRYHLYVCYACPWAHRTIIARRLKGLEHAIGMTAVDPIRDERGWAFRDGDGHGPDPINGWSFLSEAYVASDPEFDGRVTTPTLWDTELGTVVSNESTDVMRMLSSEFDEFAEHPELDLYPEAFRDEIDAINERVYATVNNGVYRCGFASTQEAYDEAIGPLFESLDWLEALLAGRHWLAGSDEPTEADWRLWVTLLRFDTVYATHFKCTRRRIVDYPNLWGFTRELYQWPGIAETVNMDHIRRHYYLTHDKLNPAGILPVEPDIDFMEPHGRS